MKSKLISETSGQRTFVAVAHPGEEAIAALTTFAEQKGIAGASLTAIGAFKKATVGWFDFGSKSYRKIAVDDNGKQCLHIHAVLGLSDGRTRGGHLLEGIVQPTLEVTVLESPAHLRRRKRRDLGIALIDLEA